MAVGENSPFAMYGNFEAEFQTSLVPVLELKTTCLFPWTIIFVGFVALFQGQFEPHVLDFFWDHDHGAMGSRWIVGFHMLRNDLINH
jgi:hypothetical protein